MPRVVSSAGRGEGKHPDYIFNEKNATKRRTMHKDRESCLQIGQRLRNTKVVRPRKMGQNDQSELTADPRTDDTSPTSKPHKTQSINQELTESTADATEQRSQRAESGDHNDEEGHLVYHEGLLLNGRYEVVSTLGKGAFGKVAKCLDRNKNEYVAVKIVRNIDCFREVARSEIAVLEEINSLDNDNTFACVRMQDWFDHEGHICIVLELLGLSTCDFIQQNHFLPFNLDQIRHMAFQLFRAVCFLHRNKLTHTDLKPENILLVSSDFDLKYNENLQRNEKRLKSIDVKVVDFGTATFDHEHHESLVSTRHYRAPEVILDLGWNQSCDVWSLGCVLMEFYLGRTLFPTHDSQEHLAMMERVLGPIPAHLLKQTKKQHYVHNERLKLEEDRSRDAYIQKHCKPLKEYMQCCGDDERQLFDLLSLMLEYDVVRRITLEEALWHPFFSPIQAKKKQRS